MRHLTAFDPNLAIAGFGFLAALVYGILGIRNRQSDPPYARAFFVTATVALLIAGLVFLQVLSSVVGYSFLCVALRDFSSPTSWRTSRRVRVSAGLPRSLRAPRPKWSRLSGLHWPQLRG